MAGEITLENLKIVGEAHCVGGTQPDPPVADFPLLAWAPLQWGEGIHTEDGKASVEQIAKALVELHSYESVAAKFKTTPEHVEQAVQYAVRAGYLGS